MDQVVVFTVTVIALFVILPLWLDTSSYEAIDGDTFKSQGTYYRLYSVDTPEEGERNYDKAREFLQQWLDEHNIRKDCVEMGKGKYDRVLVFCPNLEKELVEDNLARKVRYK